MPPTVHTPVAQTISSIHRLPHCAAPSANGGTRNAAYVSKRARDVSYAGMAMRMTWVLQGITLVV